jgi:hypothetical protein
MNGDTGYIILPPSGGRPTDRPGRRLYAAERAAVAYLRACAAYYAAPCPANYNAAEIALAALVEAADPVVVAWDHRRGHRRKNIRTPAR